MSSFRLPALLLLLGAGASSLTAQTLITLTPSSVIGGSPTYFHLAYNSGQYAAGYIFNQQSGVVSTTGQVGLVWFPSEDLGTTNRYITIDLGASYVLSSIDVFNSNQADRATGHFSLSASNSITAGTMDGGIGTGMAVSAPTMLINSTALAYSTANPVTAQSFSISDGNAYRYLQLTAIDAPGSGGPFTGLGLAEVRLYAAPIPEPSTYAALLGAGALGLVAWRRRKNQSAPLTIL